MHRWYGQPPCSIFARPCNCRSTLAGTALQDLRSTTRAFVTSPREAHHLDHRCRQVQPTAAYRVVCRLAFIRPWGSVVAGPSRRPAKTSSLCVSHQPRDAQIEKEALALIWAAERFSVDLVGLEATFQTDHQPLVTLLGKFALDVLSQRLQRFRIL